MTKPAYNEAKLAELIVYVAAKCEKHERFGATKLNKILFYSDFTSYLERGIPITGAEYQRLKYGPAPVRLLPVQGDLVRSGAVVNRESVVPGGSLEKRLIPLRPADLDLFDAKDIAIVDHVIDLFQHHSAVAVSELSHRLPCWKLAADGERIPYFTALLPEEVPPLWPRDTGWAVGVAERYEKTGS